MDRKIQIMTAMASLASEKGLGNVSLSQIAAKVGISKAALYNHFASKEEIVLSLYEYLREKSRQNQNMTDIDYGTFVKGKEPAAILHDVVANYITMNSEPEIAAFYKVVASEQFFCQDAAVIMVHETERMINATKNLFYAMQIHNIMHFNDIDNTALSFALTIHELINYAGILKLAGHEDNFSMIDDYLNRFCAEYRVTQ